MITTATLYLPVGNETEVSETYGKFFCFEIVAKHMPQKRSFVMQSQISGKASTGTSKEEKHLY